MLLTIDGVWNATRGYADEICKEGLQPLREVMESLVSNGGEVWAYGACAKPRGITAAKAVEYLASGAASLNF